MKRTDRVDWRARGTVAQVLQYADGLVNRIGFLEDYLHELHRLCIDHGFDFSILAAQSAHETADWTSPMWKQKGNPAGIGVLGVEGGAVGPNLSLTYANGVDAARAHVTHFYVYSRGAVPAGHELAAYIPLDPRYDAALEAFANTIDTLDDFNVNGRWAVVSKPPYYGDRIISKGREIFADQEQTITTPGVTPAPPEPQPLPDVPGSWQGWFDLMFGKGKWTITQDWAAHGGPDLYAYAKGHGLDGRAHPGIDVGLKYNTPMYAPAPSTVVCAGTGVGPGAPHGACMAYNDTGDGGPGAPKQGVGRIELYFPEHKASLIFGHSRVASVPAGSRVTTRQKIAESGGMYGAHCHFEYVQWETDQGYTYRDPRLLLARLAGTPQTPTTPPPVIVVPPSGGSMALVTSSRPTTLPMRKVPPPPIVYAMVTKYEHQGSKYGYVYSPTNRQNVAVMHHETQGRGSIQFYQGFFSCPNGERCGNAMVDFVIQRDGQIGMLNNPFGHWAGWANGGGSTLPGGLERHGTQFVASRGISAVDFKTVSVEYEKTSSENMTDAQVQSGGHLAAWIHDLDDQPWDTHPFVPKYNCHCSLLHYWIGTTNCGMEEEDDLLRVQAVTKGIMKQYQSGGGGEPEPPVIDPPPVQVDIPGGLTLAEAKRRFGSLTRHNVTTGKVDRGIGFDPKGTISLGWAHRAATENVWPKAENWYVLLDSGSRLDLITFANDWRMASAGERSGMQWVELMPTTEAT